MLMTKPACKYIHSKGQRGGMLVELLLSVALAVLIIPFVFRYQQNAVRRAENIAVQEEIEKISDALERYIIDHRLQLLAPVGKNITRVNLDDLADYGVTQDTISSSGDIYQLRVLKSGDTRGQATLQGVVVYTASDISPIRTREIINLGGDNMGFIEGNRAFGAFGSWRVDAVDLGVGGLDGIIDTTTPMRGVTQYLRRTPSETNDDATMLSALNLGGHDITNARFFDGRAAQFDEYLRSGAIASDNIVFQRRATIDKQFETKSATVAGALSADSRSMDIENTLSLSDIGKFSSFTTGNLWAANLTLGGLSIQSDVDAAVLKINKNLDITGGRINAVFASVAFTGSITPRLVVKSRIEDSINSSYFWDVAQRRAHLADVSLDSLSRLGPAAATHEDRRTSSAKIFGAVAANHNATAADYLNALGQIATSVRAKYRGLNLQ